MAQPQLSYVPEPHEQPYYEGLFQTADVARGGNIGGAEAVAFFSRSRLQIDTLKNIWTLADTNPTTNALDRRKFAVAIRLIQLAQNGIKAQGANLGGPPNLRPAMFDGVSGVTVPLPPQQMQQKGPPQQLMQPPPPQVQQQPPPPQQQMQQPTPQVQHQMQQPPPSPRAPMQQQQYHQAPPSPARSVGGPLSMRPPMGGPPAMSLALTPQDPYTMTPQEQSRYEDLFPNYAKPDGFMYGKEAVALFGKSGVAQESLGKIWNMVDTPVDNRLDKLEFAMAMHMIVCISKKNLPLPAALPISLKSLKAQQPGAAIERSPTHESMPAVASFSGVSSLGGGSVGRIDSPPTIQQPHQQQQQFTQPPSPQRQQFTQPLQPQQQQFTQLPPPQQQQYTQLPPPQKQQYTQPPPLPATGYGGMAISDAFEGLDGAGIVGAGSHGGAFEQPYGNNDGPPSLPAQPYDKAADMSRGTPEPAHYQHPPHEATPEPAAPIVTEKPKTALELASSYEMGDDATELNKLKATLQKLQAENISLKAQMGSLTQEERDLQRQTAATVAEIGRLVDELTKERAAVMAAKTRLLESTAELTGHKERKKVLSDLIAETKETHETLSAAEHDIYDARETVHVENASPPAPIEETDLFGGWGEPPKSSTPAPAPEPWDARVSSPAVEIAVSADSEDGSNIWGGGALLGSPTNVPTTQMFAEQLNINDDHAANPGGMQLAAPAPAAYSAPTSAPFSANPASVENMKAMAIEAEKSAREKEEFYRDISRQVAELKSEADTAEATARSLQEKADKKRGLGKKKVQKDAEQAAIEAAEKKKNYLEYQAQSSNAQAIAMESKKEADRLREQAEQAEYDLVRAESTRDAAPSPAAAPAPGYGTPAAAPSYGAIHTGYGGFGAMKSTSNGDDGLPDPSSFQSYPSYGIDSSKAAPAFATNSTYSNGLPPLQPHVSEASNGFEVGGIMGGGNGINIPAPQSGDVGYNNPF